MEGAVFDGIQNGASAMASLACVPTWHEKFREDLKRIDVPALVIHGNATGMCRFPLRDIGPPNWSKVPVWSWLRINLIA